MPSYAYTGSGTSVVTGSLAVSNVAQQVVAARINRAMLVLYNNGAMTVYVGPADVLTSTGWPIKPGEHFETSTSGALYAVDTTGTGDLRYWDELKPTQV